MKMPDQLPPVQRTGHGAGTSRPSTSQTAAIPGAFFARANGVSPSQGPEQCYAYQGEARQMCLSMFQ
jgi:hypothetical protein